MHNVFIAFGNHLMHLFSHHLQQIHNVWYGCTQICQYQHSASFNQQQKGGWVEFLLKRTSGGGGGLRGLIWWRVLAEVQRRWSPDGITPLQPFWSHNATLLPNKRLLKFKPHSFPDLSQSQLWFYFLEMLRTKLSFHKLSNHSLHSIISLVVSRCIAPRKPLFVSSCTCTLHV